MRAFRNHLNPRGSSAINMQGDEQVESKEGYLTDKHLSEEEVRETLSTSASEVAWRAKRRTLLIRLYEMAHERMMPP